MHKLYFLFTSNFIIRFIIGFAIISYLYSKNKTDKAIKTGFYLLIILGAIVLVLSVLGFILLSIFGGMMYSLVFDIPHF